MKQKIEYRPGHFLSYAEYGDTNGFPILIQHGLIASIDDSYLFDRLIQSRARLICVARPGYGESSPCGMESFAEWADILSPLIKALKLSRFDILGMSSGAPYSYSIGCKFPDRVRNIYIFSGIPALYDEKVLSHWPYPPLRNQTIHELEILAHDLFFSGLTTEDENRNDIRDSMMNSAFGVAQDLRLRFMNWGFGLSDVQAQVYMRHSKSDDSVPFVTAARTSELLPCCQLELVETGPHFSEASLNDFIQTTIMDKLRVRKK